MAEQKNYTLIATLEKQLAEHSANFERWKIDNSRQIGTPSYNDYVARVADWERDIRARIASQQGALSETGPKNVDSIIGELLDDVGIYEFMFALANIHMTDKTFIPSFVQEFGKIQRSGTAAEPTLVVPAAQFYPGYASNSFSYNTVPPTTASVPSWGTRPAVPSTLISMKKAPSPIRDFQKKPGAPFRDFSV